MRGILVVTANVSCGTSGVSKIGPDTCRTGGTGVKELTERATSCSSIYP